MTNSKRNVILIICGAVIFIAGTFIASDWLVYYFCYGKHIQDICGFNSYQFVAKFSTTCLNALLAWMIGKDGIDRKDTVLLGTAFAFTVLADFFLKIMSNIDPARASYYFKAGIITFMIVQTLFILRHSRGIKVFLFSSSGSLEHKNALFEFIWFVLIAAVVVIILVVKPAPTVSIVIVYACFLITSLAVAWGTLRRNFYPKMNAWMIAIGLSLFFCCDVNVGISSLPDKPVANNLVWMFYTPALMLLALSGYRWAKK